MRATRATKAAGDTRPKRKQDAYAERQRNKGLVKVCGYVPAEDRDTALNQLKRLRDAAGMVA